MREKKGRADEEKIRQQMPSPDAPGPTVKTTSPLKSNNSLEKAEPNSPKEKKSSQYCSLHQMEDFPFDYEFNGGKWL